MNSSTQFSSKNSSKDRHRKVNGRDRRIRISVDSAQRIFDLNKKLGHRTGGSTVEWIVMLAQPSIESLLVGNPSSGVTSPYSSSRNVPFVPFDEAALPVPNPNISLKESSLISVNLRTSEPETPLEMLADEIAKYYF
ncbi:hypothetical protein M9H77_16224 [Catharanthus roseus]|uniref:Uncharacterized protein n=1 Tax=Catharanthus roseus TaxID=4058 RepID=A0ACC0AZZ8_CATRO|nr:hypothetical protein M9H77_16224 [Catharanthus roseus]